MTSQVAESGRVLIVGRPTSTGTHGATDCNVPLLELAMDLLSVPTFPIPPPTDLPDDVETLPAFRHSDPLRRYRDSGCP